VIRLVLRSTLLLLASAVAASVVVFLLLRILKGDVATVILGPTATLESLAQVRAEYGLDEPWHAQYVSWISGLVQGDLGRSYIAQYDIFSEIRSRLGLTLSLTLASMLLASIFALIAGTYSALHVRDWRGGVVDVSAQLGIAVPQFWAGLLLITFVSVKLGWLPAGGYVPWSESPAGYVRSLTLPVLSLAIPIGAIFTRFVRSAMLDVMNEDYIRTAMAKGRTLRQAALIHGIRNASIPLVTVATVQLGTMLAGAVVIENVFTLPGLGRMLLVAVGLREVIVVQSLVLVVLLTILVLNFMLDIGYGLLDPRIRDAQRRA